MKGDGKGKGKGFKGEKGEGKGKGKKGKSEEEIEAAAKAAEEAKAAEAEEEEKRKEYLRVQKKLREIKALEEKQKAGEELLPNQLVKLGTKAALEEELAKLPVPKEKPPPEPVLPPASIP